MAAERNRNTLPKQVHPTSQLSYESQLAIASKLVPWRATWPQQGDDFGRDAFLQVVDRDDQGRLLISDLVCCLQIKSTDEEFGPRYVDSLSTSDLETWSSTRAPPTLIAMWSRTSRSLRIRTARSIRDEIDTLTPGWRNQKTVTVEFLVRDSVDDDIGHARLRKAVIDDADFLGGIKYTHEVRRRVLLADVAYGTSATSNHLGLESPSGVPKFALVGTGWVSGELDPGDVFAPDVIAVALLLFDDVWLPIGCLGVVIQAFGVEATLILLNSERFTFFVSREILCFLGDEGGVGGAAKAILQKEGDDFVPLRTENMLAPLVNVVGLRSEVSSAVIRRTRVVPPEVIERVLARTRADIAEHRLRDFVGLPPTITENQAWVDAIVVNRLAHLNFGLLAAEHFRCDVVELEGGLSAVASHKLYYHEGFHRLYPTFGAFDKILRSAGLPDARAVMRLIPVTERVSIANSRAAEDFRNWFWILGAPIIAAGGNLDEEITKRMVHIVGDKVPPAQELIARLRLRFLSFGNGMGALGGFRSSPSPGIASRAKAALRQLEIQKRAHSERRRKLIVDRYGRLPGPYDRCVCGLPAKFKFCCGRSA